MIAELKPYAEYKESGLPWHGQMPNHWAQSKGPCLRLISPALMKIDHNPFSSVLESVDLLTKRQKTTKATLRR